MEVVTHLKLAEDWMARLRQQRKTLQQELNLRNDQLQTATEEVSSLSQQLDFTRKSLSEKEAYLSRLSTQAKSLETRFSESVLRLKVSNSRILTLEQHLLKSENECIALRERAAVAFDELTPRPDWSLVSVFQYQGDLRKSSKECLGEVARAMASLKHGSPSKVKTKKLIHTGTRQPTSVGRQEDGVSLSVPGSPVDNYP